MLNYSAKFHFATILSPWIRRALIAGGFGTGSPAAGIHPEIASVVPYRDRAAVENLENEKTDIEVSGIKRKSGSSISSDNKNFSDGVPLLSEDTPFFHLDLAAAVRVAESGVGKNTY